jgi:hypothetical protein
MGYGALAMSCKHFNFGFDCKIARLEDSGRFMLEVTVRCTDCGKAFQFLGQKPGLNFDGATVSLDGLELNIGICPEGTRPSPLQGMLRGYDVHLGQSGTNQ